LAQVSSGAEQKVEITMSTLAALLSRQGLGLRALTNDDPAAAAAEAQLTP